MGRLNKKCCSSLENIRLVLIKQWMVDNKMFLISESVFHYTTRKDKLIFSIKICIQVKLYTSSVATVPDTASHVAWLHPDFPQASVYISYEMWGFKKISFWPSIQHLLLSLHSNSSVKITGAAPWPETAHPGRHISRDNVHCSVKHDCLDAGVVQIVTMTVLSTSYNTLACVNNIGVHLSVELNGDGRVQRDPGVRPPTALPPG